MKIAVISDIHGNKWALEKVLEDIKNRKISTIFNLGDSLYGPLKPIETFELLQKQNIYNISGNEDRILFDNNKKDTKNKTLKFVLEEINEEIIEWLKSNCKTKIIDDFFLCHGTPKNDNEYLIEKVTRDKVIIKNDKELNYEIRNLSQKIICCGHSHKFNLISLETDKYIINPGSVGLQAYTDTKPYYHTMENGFNKASYCIIIKEKNQFKFYHNLISYDWKSAADCALKRKCNNWVNWLKTGKI